MMVKKAVKKVLQKLHILKAADKHGGGEFIDNLSPDLCKIKVDMRLMPVDRKYARIGRNATVNAKFIYETQGGFVDIKDNVFIGDATFICRTAITIDENVKVAWGATFYDHNAHSFDYKERRRDIETETRNLREGRNSLDGKDWSVVHTKPIHVCHDAWIGANCTILNGVTIGEGAIIGYGSVVRDDIPAWAIAYGNPCKVVAYNRYKEE